MNKHVSMKKKVLSFFLAFVILFSSMPAELFTFAKAEGASDYDASVVLSADSATVEPGGSTTLKIETTLNTSKYQLADVKISLTEDEAKLVQKALSESTDSALKELLVDSETHELTFTLTESSKTYSLSLDSPFTTEEEEAGETKEGESQDEEPPTDFKFKVEESEIQVGLTPVDEPEETTPDNENNSGQNPDEQGPSDEGSKPTDGDNIPVTEPGTEGSGEQGGGDGSGEQEQAPTQEPDAEQSEPPVVEEPPSAEDTPAVEEQPAVENQPESTPEEGSEPSLLSGVASIFGVAAYAAGEDGVTSEVPNIHTQGVSITFNAPEPSTDEEGNKEETPFYELTISDTPTEAVQPNDEGKLEDLSFKVEASKNAEVEIPGETNEFTFTVSIALPEGISFEGDASAIVKAPEGAEATINGQTLTITITQDTADFNEKTYAITLDGSKLTVADDFKGSDITINATPKDESQGTAATEQTISVAAAKEETPASDAFYSLTVATSGKLKVNEDNTTLTGDLPITATATRNTDAEAEEAEAPKSFSFDLVVELPTGISFPADANDNIADVVTLPKDATATIEDNKLTITINQDVDEENSWSYPVTLRGSALTLGETDADTATISISATDKADTNITASASVDITLNNEKPLEPTELIYTLDISGPTDALIPVDRKLPAFTISATATLDDSVVIAEDETFTFKLQITLPEGTTLPQERIGVDGQTVYADGFLFLNDDIFTMDNVEGAVIGEVTYEGNVLTIPIIQTVKAPEASEPSESDKEADAAAKTVGTPTTTSWTYNLNFQENVFTLTDDMGTSTITVSAVDGKGNPLTEASAIISVSPEDIEADKDTKVVKREIQKQEILWMDNHGFADRPTDKEVFTNLPLYFQIDGGKWQRLDYTTAGDVHWEGDLPQVVVKGDDSTDDAWTLESSKELPTQLQRVSASGEAIGDPLEVKWSFGEPNGDGQATPPEVEGYEVSIKDGTWVYVKLDDLTFNVQLRWGTMGRENEAVRNAFLESFALYSGEDTYKTLQDLFAEIKPVTEPNADGTYSVTIKGQPMYDLETNELITYYIDSPTLKKDEQNQNKMDLQLGEGVLKGDDKITADFNNQAVANKGGDTTKLYPGGLLTLTLTGTTKFVAYKQWLDQGADPADRPEITFTLWRYTERTDGSINAEDYKIASQVTNDKNDFISITLDEKDETGAYFKPQTSITITSEDLGNLDKYSPEGYRYIYFLKETIGDSDATYEQVFGVVERETEEGEASIQKDSDKKPYKGDRLENDKSVYNAGTISNLLKDTKTVTLEKEWNAAAYQGHMSGVEVTFELQVDYRRQDNPNEWENAWHDAAKDVDGKVVIRTQEDITEESMAGWTTSATVPAYGPLGREARYRWVETKITQNGDEIAMKPIEGKDGAYSFTLTQDGQTVAYTSETDNWTGVDEDGNPVYKTTITNAIADTIDYDVTKIWRGINLEQDQSVTFNLYRIPSGSTLDETKDLYLTFTMTKDEAKFVTDPVPEDFTGSIGLKGNGEVDDKIGDYTGEADAVWHTIINDLPRFDDEGREYEYLLLEVTPEGATYVPTYDTTRNEEGDYFTDVINAPGTGQRIMVRKEWRDDSDSAHRGDVTIQAYIKEENGAIKKIDKASVTLKDGVWTGLIYLPKDVELDKVFILETKVGDTVVPNDNFVIGVTPEGNKNTSGTPKAAPTTNDVYQYETAHHRYEATYSDPVVINGEKTYTVTNRRLGNIDMTVTKTWKDGDHKLRDALEETGVTPYLQLSAAEGYEGKADIGDDFVQLKGSPTETPIWNDEDKTTTSRQEISLTEDAQTFYFHNLPKYDISGAVMRYTVKEVWKYGDEYYSKSELLEKLDPEAKAKLEDLFEEFSCSIAQTNYQANDEKTEGIVNDVQEMKVTNSLGNTKKVEWHKHWNDQYTFDQHQRPDLYLDIYRVVHDENENEKVEVVIEDYHWTPDTMNEVENEDGEIVSSESDPYNWTATLPKVDKYDNYGYEIFYYAVERTVVNFGAFDYQIAEYQYDGASLGTRDKITDPSAESDGKVLATSQIGNVAADYPKYALREDGTFVNSLGNTVTIQLQKIWAAMPDGYPAVDLPEVTFDVYQTLDGKVNEGDDPVAEYTVTNWADAGQSGTYLFTIDHMGDNTPTTEATENTEEGTETTAEKLPRYNENGQLYQYVVEERVKDDESESLNNLYDFSFDSNTFVATNNYHPETGQIKVKKHLELPAGLSTNDEDKFPTIQFTLTRSYTGNDGQPKQDENWSQTIKWSSDQVKDAYEQANTDDTGNVTITSVDDALVFNGTDENKDGQPDGLPITAPNGSEYVYTVTETMTVDGKDFLYGYTASAGKGDLGKDSVDLKEGTTVGELKPSENASDNDSQVTFKDAFEQKYITLKGEKVWDDFQNAFGVRPGELEVKVYRYADAQPGEDNKIKEQNITGQVDIAWNKNGDTWTYTITGKDNTKLEAYAPNGMPWVYKVVESMPDNLKGIYTSKPASGAVTGSATNATEDDAVVTIGELKNTMKTDVSFQKSWVDADDQPITQDFLDGKKLSVTFTLQVKDADGNWQNPETYFKQLLANSSVSYDQIFSGVTFTKTITQNINAPAKDWSGTFSNLPKKLMLNGEFKDFEYRVIETKVVYNNLDQEVKLDGDDKYVFDDTWLDLVESATLENKEGTWTTTNKLNLGSLTITKVWEDNGNQFGTRPKENFEEYTWAASFVVQQKGDDGQWTNVQVTENSQQKDLVITLRGTDENDSATTTVSGLPSGTYRVMEIEPGWTMENGKLNGTLIEDGGFYNGTYETTYTGSIEPETGSSELVNSVTVTNTRESVGKNISVEKVWWPSAPEGAKITAKLQYRNSKTERWKDIDSVTLPREGIAEGENEWAYTWTNLPAHYPSGSTATTEYRVIEDSSSSNRGDYVQLGRGDKVTAENGDETWMLYNVSTTELTVTKAWNGVAEGECPREINFKIYRTTGEVGDINDENATELESGGTLNKGNNWTATVDKLPAYDKDGTEFKYFAVEVDQDGKYNVAYSYSQDETTQAFATTITNTAKTTVSGTKTWVDGSDEGGKGTRPTSLTLTLYRTIDPKAEEVQWDPVEDATPVWTGTDTDTWTYTYSDLPKVDENGNVYTYKVEEATVEGYASEQEGNDFTNTLMTSVQGTKTWHDAKTGRPENLTLTLYQKLDGSEDWTIVENAEPVWSGKESDVWSYSYNNLQKYDENGVLYLYKVEEEDLSGQGYDGVRSPAAESEDAKSAVYKYDFENYKRGALEVTKSVSGNRGDKTKEFNFTVTLSGTSSNGEFKSEEFSGTYGDMTFTNGVATFTLKDGETKTALDLPAGLQYAVVEKEANEDGYTTTSSGDSGTINAGYKATAAFNNHRHHSSGGGNDKTSVSVEKEWVTNNGGTPAASVQVQLYRDGKAYGDPVTLNAGNGWSHDWTQLDANHVWTVKEVGVTDGFNVYIDRDGNTIVLVNNDIGGPDPEEPPDEPTDIPDPEKPEEENPPTDPDDPTDKPTDTPDDPTDTPDDPTDEPDKPTTDVPDTEKPNTPSNPSNPSNPSTPTYPTTSTPTTTTTTKTDKDAPQTGDNTHTRALFVLCLASLAGMTVIGVSRKRQRKDDSDQS